MTYLLYAQVSKLTLRYERAENGSRRETKLKLEMGTAILGSRSLNEEKLESNTLFL